MPRGAEGVLIALGGKPKSGEMEGDVDSMKLGAVKALMKAFKAGDAQGALDELEMLYDLCSEEHMDAGVEDETAEEDSEEY